MDTTRDRYPHPDGGQMALFESPPPAASRPLAAGPPLVDRNRQAASADGDRHLRAAQRLARRMRRLKDRSPEQTQVGLAICEQLKAYLRSSEKSSAGPRNPADDPHNRTPH
jgi:hypothetical protein